MLHFVQQKINRLSRRAWRYQAIRAMGVTVTAVVAAVFLAGLADYLLRFEDPGVRLLSSLAIAVVVIWSLRRHVVPLWACFPTDLEIAQRVEQRYPQLRDRLSTSLAFLGQSEHDQTAGSAELRRAVVTGTEADLEQIDFAESLDATKPRRVAAGAIMVCVLVAVLCWLDWPSAALAGRRLAMPWKDQPWPRRHHLDFAKRPTRLALGADFEAELVDRRGELPKSVQIQYWYQDEPAGEVQTKDMKLFGDRMVHRLENVRRSFRYRAVGGDDDTMAWIPLEVVEPPHVESLQIRLHAPAYTGWPVESSGENISALEGTVIEATGRLDKPAAAVVVKMQEPGTSQETPAQLSPDGLRFTVGADSQPPWIVHKSTAYWFETRDQQGIRGGSDRRWNIRAIPDSAPTASVAKPAGNAFVTVDALVPFEGRVKDDIAVHTIRLRFQRSDSSDGEDRQTIEIYHGPDKPVGKRPEATDPDERGDVRPIEYVWDLSGLKGLKPGVWIDYEVVAEDYRPQVGQSSTRRLTIISASELEERVSARQAFILGQLAEVLRVQREVRSQTNSVQIGLEAMGHLNRQEVDQLQAAELKQRQVERLLGDPNDGVETLITSLLHELQSNRLDSPEVVRRMSGLLQTVQQITGSQLPEIQRALISALKLAREDLGASEAQEASKPATVTKPLAESLTTAAQGQDEVIAILERLLGELSQWDNYRRFSREVSRLQQAQGELRQDTEKRRLDHLGQELDDLTAPEQADLRRLAARQVELAREFDKIQARMDQMRGELAEADPAVAETLAEAVDLARRTAIGGRMRESGRRIERHDLGQASATQQEILDNLQDLLDALANRREHALARLVDKLNTAQTELQTLRDRQSELRRQFEAAAALADAEQRSRELARLQALQRQLAEEVRQLSRRLERLTAEQAAQTLAEAASHADQSAAAAEQGDADKALAEAHSAERSLDQAQQQIEAAQRAAEQDLLSEQLARFEQEIAGLIRRQQSLTETTDELEKARLQQEGRRTRAQAATVGTLAREQRSVATETGDLAGQVAEAQAFVLALRGVVREMERAAQGLARDDTGRGTQQAERNALLRLQQLREALKRDRPSGGDDQDSKAGNQGPQQPPGDAIQRLAELKLLKLMQEEINRQTVELEESRLRNGKLTDDETATLKELAEEQGRLAQLLLDLSGPDDSRPEEEPAGPSSEPSKQEPKSKLDRELEKELLR
jgi:hypothetical protein